MSEHHFLPQSQSISLAVLRLKESLGLALVIFADLVGLLLSLAGTLILILTIPCDLLCKALLTKSQSIKPRVSIAKPKLKIAPMQDCVDPMDFFLAMCATDTYPTLRGRDVTAKELGVRPYQAKIIVAKLLDQGLIEVCGKRLKAVELQAKDITNA